MTVAARANGVWRVVWVAACIVVLMTACAEPLSPEGATTISVADVRGLVNSGHYEEALQALDDLEADRAPAAADLDDAYERLVLRAWAEAGLGDCRLAAELAQTPRPGMSDEQLARLIARAADLTVEGLESSWRSLGYLGPSDGEVPDWDERVEAATCVLDAAALRFPDDADRIEERRQALEEALRGSGWSPFRFY